MNPSSKSNIKPISISVNPKSKNFNKTSFKNLLNKNYKCGLSNKLYKYLSGFMYTNTTVWRNNKIQYSRI